MAAGKQASGGSAAKRAAARGAATWTRAAALAAALAAASGCKSDAPAPAAAATGPAAGTEIEAGLAFLKALAKLNHPEEQAAAWAELAPLAAAQVQLSGGGQSLELDVAGRKTGARLLRFAKLQSWRDGATVRGVTLGEVELVLGTIGLRGPGRLLLQAQGDRWVATALEVDAVQ